MGTESVKDRYNVVCVCDHTVHVVNIKEIDMDGWTLFECYLLLSGEMVYFSQDSEEETLEYIDMTGDASPEWTAPIVHAIRERKAA